MSIETAYVSLELEVTCPYCSLFNVIVPSEIDPKMLETGHVTDNFECARCCKKFDVELDI
jgi:transposase-like protein